MTEQKIALDFEPRDRYNALIKNGEEVADKTTNKLPIVQFVA